jgi:membrane protease YdiL (CAAX protease family)
MLTNISMKSRILAVPIFFMLVFCVLDARAKYYGKGHEKMFDTRVPLLCLVLPGGTHFYAGEILNGIVFSTSEISLFVTGILTNNRLLEDDVKELNIPLILASQVYTVDKWLYFQKSQLEFQQEYPECECPVKLDLTPLPDLLTAPFKPRVFLRPLVITFAVLGVVDGIISYPEGSGKYSDISSVVAVGNEMSRQAGTCYYESMAFATSYGAAVSEEMFFRGLLLPVLDWKLGETAGLVTTSLTFGLLHLSNSDIDRPVYLVTQATLAGLIFGYNVQRNDYRLSEAIAAHFWYDFVSMTTTWILNPKENPLGVSVTLRF